MLQTKPHSKSNRVSGGTGTGEAGGEGERRGGKGGRKEAFVLVFVLESPFL